MNVTNKNNNNNNDKDDDDGNDDNNNNNSSISIKDHSGCTLPFICLYLIPI